MKIIGKNKSLLRSWLFSYGTILILPIILSFTVYFTSVNIVTHKVISANGILQDQLADLLESKINDAEILRIQIVNNTTLNNYLFSNQPKSNAQRYNVFLTVKDFAKYIGTNQVVKDFYVYVHDTGEFITSTTLYNRELTYTQFHTGSSMDSDTWFTYLEQYHQRTLQVTEQDGVITILMICSIPNMPAYTSKATLVLFIDPDSLLSSIQEMPFAEGTTMLLLNENDQIILSNRKIAITDEIRYENLSGQPDVFQCVVDGEKALVLQSTSSTTDWKYVTLVSIDSIVRDIRPIQFSAIVYLVVSLGIGVGLSYRFARKRYQPIGRILQRIGNQGLSEGNEYDYIERNINRILTSSERMEAMFRKQQESVQHSYITSLMYGNIHSMLSGNETLLSVLGFSFISDLFAVVVFPADSQSQTPDDVIKYLNRVSSEIASFYPVKIGKYRAVMVNFAPDTDRTEAFVWLSGYLEAMEDGHSIGISQLYQGLDRIPIAYSEAVSMLAGSADRAIGNSEDIGCFFTPEQEKALLSALCAGNAVDVCKLLDMVCHIALEKNNLSFNLARCLMVSVASTAVRAVKANNTADRQVIGRIDQYIGELWCDCSTGEMKDTLRELLTYTAGHIEETSGQSSRDLLGDIMACVHDHYHDPDFNVSRLADLMEMNLSYISKFFKNNAGIGLHMYINQVRINRAKELLDSGSDISIILDQVGFENVNSFGRVFKKFVGTTPGAYKDK